MKIDNSNTRVTQHLRRLAAGESPGARLPSVRALMAQLRVSPVTVQHALDHLSREGVLEARPGQGTYVAQPAIAPPDASADLAWQSLALGSARALTGGLGMLCQMPPDEARALNAGYLPRQLQPTALLAAASARALRRPGIWARMPIEGLPALRAWFADAIPGAFQPHEVTICPGSQAANAAAFRALAAPGDAVLVESPTYLGALARGAGRRPSRRAGAGPTATASARTCWPRLSSAPAPASSIASPATPTPPAPSCPPPAASRCWARPRRPAPS